MEHNAETGAALAVALALGAGMIAQSVARHVRLPGIVLLLAAGVLLGPDVLDVVRPQTLGSGLHLLVGFAVAVILFEGGMNLGLKRLRRQARVIQLLISVGAVITAVGAALAGRYIMGWDWRLAVPFGTLVVVTGPTVITPLLRRIKVTHRVETVLEAEGVLIDAVGAVLAVITLEVVVRSPSNASIAEGAVSVVTHLGGGLLFGLLGGFIIAAALRLRRVVPEGLENVFTLSLVLVLFQVSNALMSESGIMAVTAAGIVVGNSRTPVKRELMEFKEQLTVMFIGLLFVLLAADVRIDQVIALGAPAVWTVACLMFVVRPVNIFVSTAGSNLSFREKTFLAWVAPRGVVAAAVASLFAQTFADAGIEGGEQLRAVVFTVIAGTVLIQGLSGGLVAKMLGLRRSVNRGYAVLGANALGRLVGRVLADGGHEVIFIDNNPSECKAAEEQGFRVVYGNALEERTLQRAQLEDRAGCVMVSTNEQVNLIVARATKADFKVGRVYVACRRDSLNVTPTIVHDAQAEVLFGRPRDLDLWAVRARRETVRLENWRLDEAPAPADGAKPVKEILDAAHNLLLPLTVTRGTRLSPVSDRQSFRPGDVVRFAAFVDQYENARSVLVERGWVRVELDTEIRETDPAATPSAQA